MQKLEIIRGAYYDSVTLMLAARELDKLGGVRSSFSMGTEANYRIMTNGGFDMSGVDATPADLIIGILGEDPAVLSDAAVKARAYLADPPWKKSAEPGEYRPKSLDGAVSIMPDANLSIISVAGQHASGIASECLDKGLNVMIFSDNVPLEKEIELKRYAAAKNLLVMGPDCGTAIIRGTALGMANACRVGPVGIVAAAGTGLQEVHTQLSHRGVGVLHAIGTGGRDVREEVGGLTVLAALSALAADEEIEVILVTGKPPARGVEQKITDEAKKAGKPVVLGFVGGTEEKWGPPLYFCSGLEESAAVTAALAKGTPPLEARDILKKNVRRTTDEMVKKLGKRRGYLRGLYSGGTLCYEAQLLASAGLGFIRSNVPLDKALKLADSLVSEGHTIVDYGEDEFTNGKLHPMIDPSFRCERIIAEARDEDTGVLLFDVVLGYGCHSDPGAAAAAAVREARGFCGERVLFVASVCGTDGDPQNLTAQKQKLEEAGVCVCSSNARAALLAAALLGEREVCSC